MVPAAVFLLLAFACGLGFGIVAAVLCFGGTTAFSVLSVLSVAFALPVVPASSAMTTPASAVATPFAAGARC